MGIDTIAFFGDYGMYLSFTLQFYSGIGAIASTLNVYGE
jgi:hypothetical protein